MQPDHIIVQDNDLPKAQSSKIDKPKLREVFLERQRQ
jgi:acyl-coenzyme A synthetase/AMP-(fatty) acid ligase